MIQKNIVYNRFFVSYRKSIILDVKIVSNFIFLVIFVQYFKFFQLFIKFSQISGFPGFQVTLLFKMTRPGFFA